MKWIKFTLKTTTEAIDILSYELDCIGIEGIEIEDNVWEFDEIRAKKFGEIMPDRVFDDGTAFIHFYIEPPCDIAKITEKVKYIVHEVSAYCNIGEGTIRAKETADIDWVSNWKKHFKPFRATENIVIKPTWENYEKESDSDIIIEIDPETAFGTGSHETTLLCLQALQKYIQSDMNVLDVGCGSGILSIAAVKLGAKKVTAIDIDKTAVEIASKNREVNQIEENRIQLLTGDILNDKLMYKQLISGFYDIVIANILADILIPLTSIVRPCMTKGGIYIISGIINTKEIEVRHALLENNFEIMETIKSGEWVSFICK